jgi:hypothetical protein
MSRVRAVLTLLTTSHTYTGHLRGSAVGIGGVAGYGSRRLLRTFARGCDTAPL